MGYITATSIEDAKRLAKKFNRNHTNKQYAISSVKRTSKEKTYNGGKNLYTVKLK